MLNEFEFGFVFEQKFVQQETFENAIWLADVIGAFAYFLTALLITKITCQHDIQLMTQKWSKYLSTALSWNPRNSDILISH